MVKFTPRQLSVDRRIRKGPGHKRQFALCALRIFFLNLCSHDKLHKFKPDNLGDLLREQRIFFDKFCSEYETNVRCDLFPSSFGYVFICTDIVKLLLGFKGL